MIFSANNDNIIMMRAIDADRYAGGMVKWRPVRDVSDNAPQITSMTASGTYSGSVASDGSLKPTGHTWDKSLSGRLDFSVDVDVSGSYDLLALLNTGGVGAWFWVEIDRQRNALGPRNQGRLLFNSSSMQWQGNNSNTVMLSAGLHTISLYSISSSIELSALALVPSGSSILRHDDSANNQPEQVASGDAPIVENVTYLEWYKNPDNHLYRSLLVEIDSDSRTVFASSQAYMSEHNQPYYERITNSPYLEYGLDDVNVGDIELTWPDLSENFLNEEWRGQGIRMFHGDIRWSRSRFKQIASATTDGCQLVADRTYQFNTIDDARKYDRTFHIGEDITRTESIFDAANWLMSQDGGGLFQFINIPNNVLETQLTYIVSESSNMEAMLRKMAVSIDAEFRTSQSGYVEIMFPDRESDAGFYLKEAAIPHDGISVIQTINPVLSVTVRTESELEAVRTTGANTGSLSESIEIDTYLANQRDVDDLADKKAIEYSGTRRKWSIDVEGFADVIQPADIGVVEHPQFNGSGVITLAKREPLYSINTVELIA